MASKEKVVVTIAISGSNVFGEALATVQGVRVNGRSVQHIDYSGPIDAESLWETLRELLAVADAA